jgi:hypothetical protein
VEQFRNRSAVMGQHSTYGAVQYAPPDCLFEGCAVLVFEHAAIIWENEKRRRQGEGEEEETRRIEETRRRRRGGGKEKGSLTRGGGMGG